MTSGVLTATGTSDRRHGGSGRASPALRIDAIDARSIRRLVHAFMASRSSRTQIAYRSDLAMFAAFVATRDTAASDAGEIDDASDVGAAARLLLSQSQGAANALVLDYRNALLKKGLASSTVARRLAAIRSFVKFARIRGLVVWSLDVAAPKVVSYRDTRGPGGRIVHAMLDAASKRTDAKGLRDMALLRLALDLGLRRGELVSLDRSHVALADAALHVLGKGHAERERLSLPPTSLEAVAAWIHVRGDAPGALFTNVDRGHNGERLTGTAVYLIVRALGALVGANVRPHGLRHAAITAALDATSGDVRQVQRFSRHHDIRVLGLYDDARRDVAFDVARRVAKGW
jgi:integrase/recombinase XerC